MKRVICVETAGRGHIVKVVRCRGFDSESKEELLRGLGRRETWSDLHFRKIHCSTSCIESGSKTSKPQTVRLVTRQLSRQVVLGAGLWRRGRGMKRGVRVRIDRT